MIKKALSLFFLAAIMTGCASYPETKLRCERACIDVYMDLEDGNELGCVCKPKKEKK